METPKIEEKIENTTSEQKLELKKEFGLFDIEVSQNLEKEVGIFDIEVFQKSIAGLLSEGNYSWVNPRVDDLFFHFDNSNIGKWEAKIYTSSKSISLNEADKLCSQEGMMPGTIWHLLVFSNSYPNDDPGRLLVATGSSTLDDFECRSCPVVFGVGDDRRVGLGNWRGNKLKKYCFLGVRRKN